MQIEPNPNNSNPETDSDRYLQPDDFDGASENCIPEEVLRQQELAQMQANKAVQATNAVLANSLRTSVIKQARTFSSFRDYSASIQPRALILLLGAIALTIIGISSSHPLVGAVGTVFSLMISVIILAPWLQEISISWFSFQDLTLLLGITGALTALLGIIKLTGIFDAVIAIAKKINWDASGTLAEWFGALGQILIAIIAVFIAWRQYVISKDLTIQQNLLTIQQNIITQQQTIDSYFQGISDLVLDEEGLLEDWPQERLLAEGRTAAIFSSVDGSGKAKILRFLSRSKLLTPLKRDGHLGRAILDGSGGYAEDRIKGVRVIDLGVMLAGADLANTDLRWTDLSEANLVRANLSNADLVKANLSRTILYEANLRNADLNGTRFYYGSIETATPRSRTEPPNYQTGEHTGAVVEDVDFSKVKRLSEANRRYCCEWCGEKSRKTIPGGCEGISNKLGR